MNLAHVHVHIQCTCTYLRMNLARVHVYIQYESYNNMYIKVNHLHMLSRYAYAQTLNCGLFTMLIKNILNQRYTTSRHFLLHASLYFVQDIVGEDAHHSDCSLKSDGSCNCFRFFYHAYKVVFLVQHFKNTLSDHGVQSGEVISVTRSQRGDIGVFGSHDNSSGVQYLREDAALKTSTTHDSISLIQMLGGTLTERPVCNTQHKVLDSKQRMALMQLLDETFSAKGRPDDLVMDLEEKKLSVMIGANSVKRLRDLFEDEYTIIRLRRTEGSGNCIKFHTDVSQKTMQVVLNAQSEYEGGRLVYATNEGFVQPPRLAGSYSIHTCKIVHGVTAVERGVRYALFFLRQCDSS